MGFWQGLAGNMELVGEQEAHQTYGPWLLEGEQIFSAYKTIRDGFCITSTRVITLDRQGATGKKTRVYSISLDAIVAVTAETAGAGFDDSEITITFITTPRRRAHTVAYGTYTFEFPKSFDVAALYRYFQQVATNNVAALNRD
ncbi:PH domain-containing protein [Arsenicicoccus dermatophilus]|uniref:PH domain-containing protein n=1 Tax=Arsenicicoccus dermatophilus TaxID=1076331 RepID=UPI001F4C7D89|nr:PH domain-containing protein [Arsenicicoccus dermatophilus]MCH8611620.1 PH domain-containing protein [Arsenicicoccus dermatophilus]